jgi:hypothetical protein
MGVLHVCMLMLSMAVRVLLFPTPRCCWRIRRDYTYQYVMGEGALSERCAYWKVVAVWYIDIVHCPNQYFSRVHCNAPLRVLCLQSSRSDTHSMRRGNTRMPP